MNSCVHDLIAACAAENPDAVAVVGAGLELTYRELNEWANQLAHHLVAAGVGPEVRVGLCFTRGPRMVVAMLAVLKSGGAYVPLDPDYPVERLRFMAADSGALVLLTESPAAGLVSGLPAEVVDIDAARAELAARPVGELGSRSTPDSLAYVIYTSGSTGTPKGVAVDRRCFTAHVRTAAAELLALTPDDCVLSSSSFSFDASVEQIFPALSVGAKVVLRDSDVWTAAELNEQISRHRVSVMELAPAYWERWIGELSAASVEDLDSLRAMILGGDVVPVTALEAWQRLFPGVPVTNTYGPTETTVSATAFVVRKPIVTKTVPIGRALGGRTLHVLDEHRAAVEAGQVGELNIGGLGVARGYIGRPGLTAEQFVPDPWGPPGSRMYRTGDLVRWAAHGDLEFVGRTDRQVNLRGFRIELGEIEAALRRHPGVVAATVVGGQRIHAYIVPGAGHVVTAVEVREFARTTLPGFMVPAKVSILDDLPLLLSAKVDLEALNAMESVRQAPYVAPRTPLEQQLANVWAEVLGVARVGVDDDFFELGGHSLVATTLAGRVEARLHRVVRVRTVFDHPTVAAYAEHLLTVPPQPSAMIGRASAEAAGRPSFAQEQIRFLWEANPASHEYHVPIAYRLRGPISADRLETAVRDVCERHSVLRSRIVNDDSGHHRVAVANEPAFQLRQADLSGSDEQEVRRAALGFASAPFDLDSESLVRGMLLRTGPDEHLFVVVFHHLVFDGWSVGIFQDELTASYAARSAGVTPHLPEPVIQYRDFAAWQREWLSGGTMDRLLAFWGAELAGLRPVELPSDLRRPVERTGRGDVEEFVIPPELLAGVSRLARQHSTTLFMTLLSVYLVVLSRYSGQHDIAVGTPVAGRGRPEVDGLIGLFVNTVVLRTNVSGDPAFTELLDRVRESTLAAFDHQELPFDKLVEHLRPERDLSRNPLVQMMFALEEFVTGQVSLGTATGEPVELNLGAARFDVSMHVSPEGQGFVLYSPDLFAAGTVRRLIELFLQVLGQVVADPGLRLSELDLLDAIDRRRLLPIAPDPAAEPTPSVAQLIAGYAVADPDAVALACDGVDLTYRDLVHRATRLAHRLRSAGVGRETRVGLCLGRGVDAVVAMVAVWQAGGAYVPLDPEYPADRLRFMAEDSGVALVITEQALTGVAARTNAPLLMCDQDPPADLPEYPEWTPDASSLAYVIYTSGSTGRPKGVAVDHRSLAEHVLAARDLFDLTAADTMLAFASFSFDASVQQIFCALAAGAKVVLRPATVWTPRELTATIRAEGVSVLELPPSYWEKWAAELAEDDVVRDVGRLRLLVLGGDVVSTTATARWQQHMSAVRLVNAYGPTETTVIAAAYEIPAGTSRARVPIGLPLADRRGCVLDSSGLPVPAGATGELHLGGCLARGYLGRPGLTAERFVPDPFGGPGARLYRTGDLVRWSPDGFLEFLGRVDNQVKVRGYRVELGEVEAMLAAHAAVGQAVATVREDVDGERRIIGYVRSGGGELPDLRTYLQSVLPAYLVPAQIVEVARFPALPSGKIDRAALPEPVFAARAGRVEPATPTERKLAGIWAEVLGVPDIGVEDGFFDIGGDSIMALRVVGLARRAGLGLTVPDMFRARKLRQLATVAEGNVPAPRRPSVLPWALVSDEDRAALPADVVDAYPLTTMQAGMLHEYLLDQDRAAYLNITNYHLRIPGFDPDAFQRAVDLLVERHEVLRTSFDFDHYSVALQLVHRVTQLRVDVQDLRGRSPEDQQRAVRDHVEEEKQVRLDLGTSPLLRLFAHRLTEMDIRLTVTDCHAILDGWSLTSLIGDAIDLHNELVHGRTPRPAVPPLRFADHVVAEREAVASSAAKEFWRDRLQRLRAIRVSAGTRQRGAQVFHEVRREFGELELRLHELAKAADVPYKSILLAAFYHLMGVLREDEGAHSIGLVTNGRPDEPGAEQMAGLFLNTVPYGFASGAGTWLQLIRAAFEAERELLPHRRFPFAEMHRAGRAAAAVEVAFNYVNFHRLPDEARSDYFGVSRISMPLVCDAEQGAFVLQADVAHVPAETAERLADMYLGILHDMAADPAAAVRVPEGLLTPPAGEPVRAGEAEAVHLTIARQAARAPDAVALVCQDTQVTYGQLNERANKLARHLRAAGVTGETVVGLLLGRGVDMVVAMVAVWKAGGAWVPLDTTYPAPRLAYLVSDSAARLVITDTAAEGLDVPVLSLSGHADAIAARPATDPEWACPADALAYVLHTSGSTGLPKGVAVEHRALASQVRAVTESYRLGADDRVLCFASFAFDPAVEQVFPTLAAGARVVLRPDPLWTPAELAEQIHRHRISVVNVTPAYAQQWIRQPSQVDLESLRLLVFGGDVLPPPVLALWRGRHPAVRILNAYGPTETTITATTFEAGRGDAPRTRVPIGRPLGERSLRVVGPHGSTVPVGVAGELYIGGAEVARGYVGRPALTAERFVPAPHGARLYRTGDLVRWLPSGDLEFLGRADNQVKVRGVRVELGEIEAGLVRLPGVCAAAVVARTDADGDTRIFAYVTPTGAQQPVELLDELKKTLPATIVPAAVTVLDDLPLLPTGKVDRDRLPDPEVPAQPPYTAPRTPVEEVLAEVWAEILHTGLVGVHDDFFLLGGHSLLAAALTGRIWAATGVRVPLGELMANPTVADLARVVESAVAAEVDGMSEAQLRALQTNESDTP